MRTVFLNLLRLGIGQPVDSLTESVEWDEIRSMAARQGLSAIILDGIGALPAQQKPAKVFLLEWIGSMIQSENKYSARQRSAEKLASLFHQNGIRTYVLKGAVVSECYPKPEHRVSVDMDCYLLPDKGDFDAWESGNRIVASHGFKVGYDYYKNSTFFLPDLMVENHRYFTPFRGNGRLEKLEKYLQSLMGADGGTDRFDGTWLYRPPVMATALFLVEHAYSHFLHEGLTWRLILDWVLFSRKHKTEIDWEAWDVLIDENGFRKFYDSFRKLGRYLIAEVGEEDLTREEKRMLEDVWADLDLHETVRGFRGKMALVGNTLRARWKYRHFTEISTLHALWIQVKGFLFIKDPVLSEGDK